MKWNTWVLRIGISTVIGLMVFALSVLAAWRNADTYFMRNPTVDLWTSSVLRGCAGEILSRQEQGLPLPGSLEEFAPVFEGETFSNSRVKMLKHGVPVDGWGRPLVYELNGTTCTLVSYGRDGLPGGTGFDRDKDLNFQSQRIDYDKAFQDEPPMPSLRQFLFELPSGGMIKGCAVSGLLAFIASLFLVHPRLFARQNLKTLLVRILPLIAATVLFALMIAGLHVPSGH